MRQMLCQAVAVREDEQVLRPHAGPDLVFARILDEHGKAVDVPFEVGKSYVIEIRQGDLGTLDDDLEELAKLGFDETLR